MKSRKVIALIATLTSVALINATPAFAATLNGSGATFAAPLIDACKVDYAADKGHTINYPGGGSGKGRSDFAGNLVDFAGSDAPYSSGAPAAANFVYVPVYAAPIAIMYNLPSYKGDIYLTPDVLAQIYAGEITNWSDPTLRTVNNGKVKIPVYKTKVITVKDAKGKSVKQTVPALDKKGNPTVVKYVEKDVNASLPNTPITVMYRTESSGTSENFTKYLKGANAAANAGLWPKAQSSTFINAMPKSVSSLFNFQGFSGSAALSAAAKGTVGSIAYSELSYATDNNLKTAYLQNAAGEFVPPSSAGTSAFLGGGTINANGTVDVDFDASIKGAYSLGITSYGLAYTAAAGKTAATQAIVADWFTYLLDKCPGKYPAKGFAQITGPLYDKAKAQIALIK